MKVKLLASASLGLLMPWLYFIFVSLGPIRYVGGNAGSSLGQSGVASFVAFYGGLDAVFIYMQTALISSFVVFVVFYIYSRVKNIF